MSGHGLKAVAIQYSWLREPGFALMEFVALKTGDCQLRTAHERPRLESRGNSIPGLGSQGFALML